MLRRGFFGALTFVALLAGCSADDDDVAAHQSSTTAPSPSGAPSTASSTSSTSTSATSTSTTSTTTTVPAPPPPATIADLLALERPIVLAHTGGEDEFPGSTMFAFGESMKAGVDMLDLNVQLTGDGVVIIQHDDTVDRTTEGTGDVVDMDLATIQALDNAYSFTDGRAVRTTTTSTAASAPASDRRRPATPPTTSRCRRCASWSSATRTCR